MFDASKDVSNILRMLQMYVKMITARIENKIEFLFNCTFYSLR